MWRLFGLLTLFAFAVSLLVTYWQQILAVALVGFILYKTPTIIRYFLKRRYFASQEFQQYKVALEGITEEHNQIVAYADELLHDDSFILGISDSGRYAHLATSTNTSEYNYRRDRNVATLGAPNVHNCSLQTVRNAEIEPIKYVVKYFDIEISEDSLARIEKFGENLSRLENAVDNVNQRELAVIQSIDPPSYIKSHFLVEFYQRLGFYLVPIEIPFPSYSFQYVSAGGNSSQQTDIEFKSETIDALTEWMSERIKFRQSVAGQRALMTKKLREYIKERDGHSCQNCGLSTRQEPNLLLEIDHIRPLSKGGMTTVNNLQTLCWRCNRTKSAKWNGEN